MIEIKGKYNIAKIFTDKVDDKVWEQVQTMCDQEFTAGSQIRIMPDVHKGAGCTIGITMTIQDKLVPNIVGVDIGCGMETVLLAEKNINFESIRRSILIERFCVIVGTRGWKFSNSSSPFLSLIHLV